MNDAIDAIKPVFDEIRNRIGIRDIWYMDPDCNFELTLSVRECQAIVNLIRQVKGREPRESLYRR